MAELTPHQLEALDYKNHISLTANAGSGKTFVLSKRFVEILTNEEIDIASIVAITFTEKAAGELNKKIATEIDLRIKSESKNKKRIKLESLRRQLVSANISTIHSFCINILKEFAPEAGIDAAFSVIDSSTSDELISLCASETINNLLDDSKYCDDLKYLIRFFGSKNIFISQLERSIHQRRNVFIISQKIYSKDEDEIFAALNKLFETTLTQIFGNRIEEAINKITKINGLVLTQNKTNKHGLEVLRVISSWKPGQKILKQIKIFEKLAGSLFTNEYTVRKSGYLNKEREKFVNEINLIENIAEDISVFFNLGDVDTEKILIQFGKTFLKIFDYTLNLYTHKKKQKSFLDFEDLLLSTQKLLKRDEVRNYLSSKYKFIMIDEYQDTNEIQYEIFLPLLENLTKGNLFVVGDEKQSIYMFRDAELDIFDRTKEEISNAESSGKLLNLPHSFRMAPQLVLFTNYLFSNLFNNPQKLFNEVEYNELICTKDEPEIGKVEFLISNSESSVTESNLVAQKILQLKFNSSIELKDIAILCRKRDSFVEIEKELAEKGIPFSIIGGKGFFQRQTVYDIYNYLSFLLDNENDAALIGILRSPFFNLTDLNLFEISFEAGKTFFQKLHCAAENSSQLAQVVNKLQENILLAPNADINYTIRKILTESNYWTIIAAKRNSSQEIANVEKILLLAREFSKKSFRNLFDFTVALRESIDELQDEGQAQVSKDENTVKILTIHQAKGLEFKTVFLYGCNDTVRDSSVRAKNLFYDKKFGIITKVPEQNKYFNKYVLTPVGSIFNFINQKKIDAESKRLLYVGVTRAVNYLFISAVQKDNKVHNGSFLKLIAGGLNMNLDEKEFTITSTVKFMKLEKEYKFISKQIALTIPICTNVIADAVPDIEEEKFIKSVKEISAQKIPDIPSGEIISATKISMFTQCPVKYQLTYELGYTTIHNLPKSITQEYEFNSSEDDELKKYAQLKGRIIHSLLKDEIKCEDISSTILERLVEESFDINLKNQLVDSISKDVLNYYSSNTFDDIQNFKKYKNEFEVYCKEGNHFLYGIIDKLIFKKDELLIIDYKTDEILIGQVTERAESYFPQLTFYAYVLAKLYPEIHNFTLRLIFLKHPERLILKKIVKEDLNKFSLELHSSIEKINSSKYHPNLQHCSKCHFALEGNICIKPN